MARLREEKEKEREKAREIVALQMQREEEAMARRRAEKEKAATAPLRREIPDRTADVSGRPPLPLAGTKPSWREREAAKAAGGAVPAAAAAPVPAAAPRTSTPLTERTDSNERPSAGPPRIALAGNKPSWRERVAAKEAGGASSEGSGRDTPPAPRAVSGTRPVSGRVPMERGDSGRGENGRTASPAPPAEPLKPSGAPGKYVPKWKREQAGGS